jgi:hypothetical protein
MSVVGFLGFFGGGISASLNDQSTTLNDRREPMWQLGFVLY